MSDIVQEQNCTDYHPKYHERDEQLIGDKAVGWSIVEVIENVINNEVQDLEKKKAPEPPLTISISLDFFLELHAAPETFLFFFRRHKQSIFSLLWLSKFLVLFVRSIWKPNLFFSVVMMIVFSEQLVAHFGYFCLFNKYK